MPLLFAGFRAAVAVVALVLGLGAAPVGAEEYADIPKLQQEAQAGKAKAQSELAECYYEGKRVRKNERQAVEWFRKAAEQGDAGGQVALAACYRGIGVQEDARQAVEWARKAADQGHVDAQAILGVGSCLAYCDRLSDNARDDNEK